MIKKSREIQFEWLWNNVHYYQEQNNWLWDHWGCFLQDINLQSSRSQKANEMAEVARKGTKNQEEPLIRLLSTCKSIICFFLKPLFTYWLNSEMGSQSAAILHLLFKTAFLISSGKDHKLKKMSLFGEQNLLQNAEYDCSLIFLTDRCPHPVQ